MLCYAESVHSNATLCTLSPEELADSVRAPILPTAYKPRVPSIGVFVKRHVAVGLTAALVELELELLDGLVKVDRVD